MTYTRIVLGIGLIACLSLAASSFSCDTRVPDAVASVVFVGTSPGAESAEAFLQIPARERKVDFITWRLSLSSDPQTKTPITFQLERDYGFYIDNWTDKAMGKILVTGTWEMTKGTRSNPTAVVYLLHSGQHTIAFLKLDDNLLHLLDTDKSLMIGTGGQGFTLSKTDGIHKPVVTANTVSTSTLLTSGIRDTALTFVGRTPCMQIAQESKWETSADCFKLKWSLTLLQDPVTFQPAGYRLNRTRHRASIIVGNWKIIKGIPNDPNAIVYQIDPDKPGYSLRLLKGDDNVLFFLDKAGNPMVGNDKFCYTLNRELR
jgi:hypothetical protein